MKFLDNFSRFSKNVSRDKSVGNIPMEQYMVKLPMK